MEIRRGLSAVTVTLLAFALASIVGCQGQNRQQPSIGVPDTARVRERIRPPYTTNQVALAEFRPQIPAGVDTGGRCRENAYAVQRWGLRGVTWRIDGPDRRFWRIDVAIDSTGAVRRYYEDRYGYTAGRTIIRVDFDAGQGSAENSIPSQPAQTAVGDASTVFQASNLDSPSSRAARFLERCRASLDPWGVVARFPDSLQPPPEPRRPPRIPTVNRSFQNASHGVGYLKAVEGAVMVSSSFEWLQQLILPLYREADGLPAAWLARGWLAQPGVQQWTWNELEVGGWISTGYDAPAGFVVLETRDGGWFRFRYAAPAGEADGTAWAHESHLTLGDVELSLTEWEAHFLAQDLPTFFRAPGRYALRRAPSDSSEVLHWLETRERESPEYSVAPLEIEGEWMRVRAQWPGGWCGRPVQRTAEGWIRWRVSDKGPLLAQRGLIC
ncbi:MAG: hypothetical protein ACRDIC_18840 [bacterium]